MLFLVTGIDKKDGSDLRQSTRDKHLEYLRSSGGMVKFGGPLLDSSGENIVGNMVVIESPDFAQAKAWATNEPYSKAGLFQSIEVRPWRWIINNPRLRQQQQGARQGGQQGGGARPQGRQQAPAKS